MVFVLRRHIGESDPDHPVADDEEDGSERQGFVAQPLPAPGLKHTVEKSQTTIPTGILLMWILMHLPGLLC